MTPMMKQYFDLKVKYPKGILFFRMGDFYEVFGEEALMVAPKLGIALSSREQGTEEKIPFCGVPHHSAKNYWAKLLKMGHSVAIADQMEEAQAGKGIVRRDVTKILTPGSLEDPDQLDPERSNYLIGLYEIPQQKLWTLALAEVSTGEFRVGTAESFEKALEWVRIFHPQEILIRRFEQERLENALSPLSFYVEPFYEKDLHGPFTLLESIFLGHSSRVEAPVISGVLGYLKELQLSLNRFQILKPLKDPQTLTLSDTVVRDLELFETSFKRETKGSFLAQIQQTITPMGTRLLKWQILHPFQKPEPILERHEQVQSLLDKGPGFLQEIRGLLSKTFDIQRLGTRLSSRLATPTDLGNIQKTLQNVQKIQYCLSNHTLAVELKQHLSLLDPVEKALSQALIDDLKGLGTGSGVFRQGYDLSLDEAVSLSQHGQEKVDEYQATLQDSTGISSLKIKTHKSFGLLIEVTKTHLSKIPKSFIRRQTMTNNERFVTEDLVELDQALMGAQEKAIERETVLYETLLEKLAPYYGFLESLGHLLAHVDLMQSFAWIALTRQYVKPELSLDNQELTLQGARHPVVEQILGRHRFTSHDLYLSESKRQVLITGPNMAGKSTVMREVALCGLLCQMGSYVPAEKAKLPIFDQIFTRVGASDDLSSGLSTFMVEMKECSLILKEATSKSLVILDEVGRGTSTEDGLAIAKAIWEYLLRHSNPWTLFATHYHELVPFCQELGSVQLLQTEVLEKKGQITFTHRLIKGASRSSFGIEVARLSGMTDQVIQRAKFFLSHHQPKQLHDALNEENDEKDEKHLVNKQIDDIIQELEHLNLSQITPLRALNLLEQWQQMLYLEEPLLKKQAQPFSEDIYYNQ